MHRILYRACVVCVKPYVLLSSTARKTNTHSHHTRTRSTHIHDITHERARKTWLCCYFRRWTMVIVLLFSVLKSRTNGNVLVVMITVIVIMMARKKIVFSSSKSRMVGRGSRNLHDLIFIQRYCLNITKQDLEIYASGNYNYLNYRDKVPTCNSITYYYVM